CFEQHGETAGLDAARGKTRERALRGIAAYSLRVGQHAPVAGRAVPVVPLHGAALAGNGRHADAMTAVWVAAHEARGVPQYEVPFEGIHGGPVSIGDLWAQIARGLLCTNGQLRCGVSADVPGVVQLQV